MNRCIELCPDFASCKTKLQSEQDPKSVEDATVVAHLSYLDQQLYDLGITSEQEDMEADADLIEYDATLEAVRHAMFDAAMSSLESKTYFCNGPQKTHAFSKVLVCRHPEYFKQ